MCYGKSTDAWGLQEEIKHRVGMYHAFQGFMSSSTGSTKEAPPDSSLNTLYSFFQAI